ncbi:MAG: CAP domain-containing protein, partial [Caulobacteraceae bacterium]
GGPHTPRAPLAADAGLAAAAQGFADTAGPAGVMGHTGPDGSTLSDRLARNCIHAGLSSEVIAYGQSGAAAVVRSLIIDDGLASRAHRSDIFSPAAQEAGAGCAPHKAYNTFCVIDLAGAVMAAGNPAAAPPATVSKSGSARDCWIDTATGKPVRVGPPGWRPTGGPDNPDPDHVEFGGRSFVRLPGGNWVDAATGNPVSVGPPGWRPTGGPDNPDPDHVEFGGRTFVRAPCADSSARVR